MAIGNEADAVMELGVTAYLYLALMFAAVPEPEIDITNNRLGVAGPVG